ncbi:MAG: GNAT family N-acetyltransferase [Methanoregula sp.]|jgi:predicted N-acetyltransferase YhbS
MFVNITLNDSCKETDWQNVVEILKSGGMSHYKPDIHRRAFENSHAAVFAFDGPVLVGFGRVISDGTYQAGMYDVAVAPEYQGRGIGAAIVKALLEKVKGCNVILYASPGKEGFYGKQGFRKMKTGMALFLEPERMAGIGFTE